MIQWVVFVVLAFGLAEHVWRQPSGDVTMLCSTALRRVMNDLGPRFERASQQRLVVQYGTSASLAQRIEKGERFDLAVLTPELIDRLVTRGAIVAQTRTSIARAPMALAICSGSRKPDVTTTGALTATLLAAQSIAYAKDGAAGLYFASLLERLGIAEAVRRKSVLTETGGQVSEAVADGSAEMGVLPLSEIRRKKHRRPGHVSVRRPGICRHGRRYRNCHGKRSRRTAADRLSDLAGCRAGHRAGRYGASGEMRQRVLSEIRDQEEG